MEKLSDFINFNKNDMLSKMSDNDVDQFLRLLDRYYLEYRKSLGISNKYTFGIEIEAEYAGGIMYPEANYMRLKKWCRENESTLKDGDEFISPILTDNIETWQDIEYVCKIISKAYKIEDTCGGHIHIGANILGENKDNWINFFKIWSVYENIIYRFAYGEYLTPRTYISRSITNPIANSLWQTLKYEEVKKLDYLDLIKLFYQNFRHITCLNLHNVKNMEEKDRNTIEIRCPNGTLNPIIWQNNINFFIKLLLYCSSKKYNEETLLNRKLKNGENYYFEDYSKINLEQAIELSDLIFDNNLDKVYFLRQYLKSFEISDKIGELVEAKRFTKQ